MNNRIELFTKILNEWETFDPVTTSNNGELYQGIINIVSNMKKTREIEKYLQNEK